MKTLNLGGISIPISMATQANLICGIRGSGKTNTGSVMAEELLSAGVPIVVIDPTDAWWGLRSSRDGQKPGFPVMIFGGDHGDLPLREQDGKVVAEFVAKESVSVILSLRHLRKAEQRRFVRAFAEELYHIKGRPENRTPLTVFIDEAPLFIPKNPIGDVAFVVGAIEDLVARGRNAGIGVVLIGQRPVAVNADVRSICDSILTHRITGPLDRKEFGKWLEENVEIERTEALSSLAGLRDGEAWLWSGSMCKRFQVRERTTFDSSQTPKLGKSAKAPRTLAEVDIDSLRQRMSEAVKEAEQNDPKMLRARIAELERKGTAAVDVSDVVAKAKEEARGAFAPFVKSIQAMLESNAGRIESVRGLLSHLESDGESMRRQLESLHTLMSAKNVTTSRVTGKPPAGIFLLNEQHTSSVPAKMTIDSTGLQPRQAKVLKSLLLWRTVGFETVSRPMCAFLADRGPSSSSYEKDLGSLRTAGLIDYPSDGQVCLTDAGRRRGGTVGPMTRSMLVESIRGLLEPRQVKIFNALLDRDGKEVSRPDLANLADRGGSSSSFEKDLGRMRSIGLIDYPKDGFVKMQGWVFV